MIMNRPSAHVLAGLLLSFLISAEESSAQWSWPEKGENLQQLPADTPPQRLRAVMAGFSRSLGVRCNYCHVGEDGQDLSTFDFSSDAKETKQTARLMLEMMGEINRSYLAKVDNSKGVKPNFWCHSCHSGRPIPYSLQEEMDMAFDAGGAKGTEERFLDLHGRYQGRGAYNFNQAALNAVGYKSLQAGDFYGALGIFELNCEQFPEAANAWDSLGEAQVAAGKLAAARRSYQRVLELKPGDENALKQLEALKDR